MEGGISTVFAGAHCIGSGENGPLHHLKVLQNWGHEGKTQPLIQSQKGNLSRLESSLKGWKSWFAWPGWQRRALGPAWGFLQGAQHT